MGGDRISRQIYIYIYVYIYIYIILYILDISIYIYTYLLIWYLSHGSTFLQNSLVFTALFASLWGLGKAAKKRLPAPKLPNEISVGLDLPLSESMAKSEEVQK